MVVSIGVKFVDMNGIGGYGEFYFMWCSVVLFLLLDIVDVWDVVGELFSVMCICLCVCDSCDIIVFIGIFSMLVVFL